MIRKLVIILLLAFSFVGANGQPKQQVELFCGADLYYADVNFIRLYNVLLNLTPGVKYHMGHDWQLAAQAEIPIVNEGYANRYNMIRLSLAAVSKQFHFPDAKQHFKLSAGLFGSERYGADLRWMYPVNSWLMLNARLGVVRDWQLGFDFDDNTECDFGSKWYSLALLGGNIWLDPWHTELRATGGRYLGKDYGCECEAIRHFNHCSVSLFFQLHELTSSQYRKKGHSETGGFRLIVMLPPYKKSREKVVFRPASNFNMTYYAQSGDGTMKKYFTDPEENGRTNAIDVDWGTGKFEENQPVAVEE